MDNSRIYLLLFLFVLGSTCSWHSNDATPGNSLAETLSGQRVMVAYTPPQKDSLRSAHFMPILCDVLKQRLAITCVNIFGSEGELLRRAGVSPKEMFDQWMSSDHEREVSNEYYRGLRALDVRFGMSELGGVLRPIMHFFWEASYIIEIEDLRKGKEILAHLEGAGGKWGWRTQGTWQGAYRNAAKDFVRKLAEVLVLPEDRKSEPDASTGKAIVEQK